MVIHRGAKLEISLFPDKIIPSPSGDKPPEPTLAEPAEAEYIPDAAHDICKSVKNGNHIF